MCLKFRTKEASFMFKKKKKNPLQKAKGSQVDFFFFKLKFSKKKKGILGYFNTLMFYQIFYGLSIF